MLLPEQESVLIPGCLIFDFYEIYFKYFLFEKAKPNTAHFFLAELEEAGKLKVVITQNIDGLHQKAGSKNVVELHGNQREYYCIECKKRYGKEILISQDTPKCGECNGNLRPDIVLYNERLSENHIDKAIDYISNSDLLLVLGSSLTVYPACELIRYGRGEMIIINNESTPYDEYADIVINENISSVFKKAFAQ